MLSPRAAFAAWFVQLLRVQPLVQDLVSSTHLVTSFICFPPAPPKPMPGPSLPSPLNFLHFWHRVTLQGASWALLSCIQPGRNCSRSLLILAGRADVPVCLLGHDLSHQGIFLSWPLPGLAEVGSA